jgi:hypothetical protein
MASLINVYKPIPFYLLHKEKAKEYMPSEGRMGKENVYNMALKVEKEDHWREAYQNEEKEKDRQGNAFPRDQDWKERGTA